jgi:hypothetical protein
MVRTALYHHRTHFDGALDNPEYHPDLKLEEKNKEQKETFLPINVTA